MSTKIYYAWRFPSSKLNEFIDLIHDMMMDIVETQIRELMESCKVDEQKLKEELVRYGTYSEERFPVSVMRKKFSNTMKIVKELSPRGERCGGFDLDCGVNLWLNGRYWYAIPICEYWIKDKLELPDWVEDYSYWDNTDPPEDISWRKWEARGIKWEQINCGRGKSDHNARRLYHTVIDFSSRGSYVHEVDLQFRIFPEG